MVSVKSFGMHIRRALKVNIFLQFTLPKRSMGSTVERCHSVCVLVDTIRVSMGVRRCLAAVEQRVSFFRLYGE